MEQDRMLGGLLCRRSCYVPTLRGWLLLLTVAVILAFGCVRGVYSFLATNSPLPGGILVVEGWLPDYALEAARDEFNRTHYDRLYIVGGPLDSGAPLSEYKTFAELGCAVLLKLGLTTNAVQAVPAPRVRQDRTYTAAASLATWARAHDVVLTNVHLVSLGPHARRSRLMFEKAFGKDVHVGVTAIAVREYDPGQWWRSSAGVRGVTDEALAYVYARILFRPPKV